MASTAAQLRQGRGISKFFAKGNSKGAVHVNFGKIIKVGLLVWYFFAGVVECLLQAQADPQSPPRRLTMAPALPAGRLVLCRIGVLAQCQRRHPRNIHFEVIRTDDCMAGANLRCLRTLADANCTLFSKWRTQNMATGKTIFFRHLEQL